MEFLYPVVLKVGFHPRCQTHFCCLLQSSRCAYTPCLSQMGQINNISTCSESFANLGAHQIIWKQESLDQMDKHWEQSQCFTGLTLEFLVLLNFFCRLGAEQHVKVLGQVIGPSPQFQIIMNHIPAIWFQFEQSTQTSFWTIPA